MFRTFIFSIFVMGLLFIFPSLSLAGKKTSQGGGLGYACFANGAIAKDAIDKSQNTIKDEFFNKIISVEVLENVEYANFLAPSIDGVSSGMNSFAVAHQYLKNILWYAPYFVSYVSKSLDTVEREYNRNLSRPRKRLSFIDDSGSNMVIPDMPNCVPVQLARWTINNGEFGIAFDIDLLNKLLRGGSQNARLNIDPKFKFTLLVLHEALYGLAAQRHFNSSQVRELNAAIFLQSHAIRARFQGNMGRYYLRLFNYLRRVGFQFYADDLVAQNEKSAQGVAVVPDWLQMRRREFASLLHGLDAYPEVIRYFLLRIDHVIKEQSDAQIQEIFANNCDDFDRNLDCAISNLSLIGQSSLRLESFVNSLSQTQAFLLVGLTMDGTALSWGGENLLIKREEYEEYDAMFVICHSIDIEVERLNRTRGTNPRLRAFRILYEKSREICRQK